jgi:hypothetical protein
LRENLHQLYETTQGTSHSMTERGLDYLMGSADALRR